MSDPTAPTTTDPVVEIESSPLSEREKFYWELGYKEPIESMERIEDTAKFIAGAVTGSCGLLLSSLRIAMALDPDNPPDMQYWWFVAACWVVSLLLLFLVLFPLPWFVRKNSVTDLESKYKTIRNNKYIALIAGTAAFLVGLVIGLVAISS